MFKQSISANMVHLPTMLALLGIIGAGNTANILFYQGFGSYSHKIGIYTLAGGMAEKGHSVTVISPHPEANPNPKITEIFPKGMKEMIDNSSKGMLDKRLGGELINNWAEYYDGGLEMCRLTLADRAIRDLVNTGKFDLVVVDSFCSECGLGFAQRFKAKIVLLDTASVLPWHPEMVGFIPETSWIPDMEYHPTQPIKFLDRLWSTVRPLYWHLFRRNYYYPKLEDLFRTELQIQNVRLSEVEQRISLYLFNTHYSSEYGRSLPPSAVSIGGFHIKPITKSSIPKEIEEFIAGSSDAGGFVFIAFGSLARASEISGELRSVFFDVLIGFKTTRFLWVWDTDRPAEMPGNVMTVKWAPQREILAHKKTKAFISHGGGLSIQESTYYGVPLIMFPLFGDQDYNTNIVQEKGYGISLEISQLTVPIFRDAVSRVLTDPKYKSRALEISALFKDRQNKPLDTAVWWTEYVIRHDTECLKPLSIYQTWYERRLLDVWAFLFSVFVFSVLLVFVALKKCLAWITKTQSSVGVQGKKLKTKTKTKNN